MIRLGLGLDLGQTGDPAALVLDEAISVEVPTGEKTTTLVREPTPMGWVTSKKEIEVTRTEWTHNVRFIQRFDLGTSYIAIVNRVVEAVENVNKRWPDLERSPLVCIDHTGVGRPIYDLFVAKSIPGLVPITITSGASYRFDETDGGWHVPKKDLVGVLQSALQSGRLKIADKLSMTELLKRELENFRVKVTKKANEVFEAWRSGDHDDIVLALAIVTWVIEKGQKTLWIA